MPKTLKIISEKKCTKCKIVKSIFCYYKKSDRINRTQPCIDCSRIKANKNYNFNKEKYSKNSLARYHKNPWRQTKTRYGIEKEDYEKILQHQNNKCAVCNIHINEYKKTRFDIDHNHKSGAVRGLLCNSCNAGIGNFQDDETIIERTIVYLESESTEFVYSDRTDTVYNELSVQQEQKCAICLRNQEDLKYKLCVDHNHETNLIRGLLCMNCNAALGHFSDNIGNIKISLRYLMNGGEYDN